mmetsp:Transcript_22498/g.70383  ORF Transcript_22498/g.70383 Transcript_22498/m.70383 type:complete len:87 (+) Transcript_22498:3073-3333(+)
MANKQNRHLIILEEEWHLVDGPSNDKSIVVVGFAVCNKTRKLLRTTKLHHETRVRCKETLYCTSPGLTLSSANLALSLFLRRNKLC